MSGSIDWLWLVRALAGKRLLLMTSLLLMQALLLPPSVHSVCSQFIALSGVSSQGNITSPGWPSPYPPDANCQYKLQGEAWQGIKITFLQFDLEPRYSAGCLNDYLEINTVDVRGQRTFLGRFCGMQLPGPILVLHPTAELVFRSNHAVHSTGFVATYEFVDEAFVTTPRLNATSPCGEVVHGIGGTIVSPGYPKGYAAGLDCLWLIRVRYTHAIYVRVQHLEFQGSTANCQKAQLRFYDGYEHSLEDHTVLKKFCGDTRFYKGDEEKVLLSERNRLLIRFTTSEPSKPVNDSDAMVGFRLVWSDVEFNTPGNCTKSSRFPCQEAQICFTHHHKGGTSSCPDLRHYCISSELVCDGISHCGEIDPSDERNCYKTPIMVTVVAAPLAILSLGLCICFCFFNRSRRKEQQRRRSLAAVSARRASSAVVNVVNSVDGIKANNSSGVSLVEGNGGGGLVPSRNEMSNSASSGCCDCCCISPSTNQKRRGGDAHGKDSLTLKREHHEDSFIQNSAPITRGPIYFKSDLESPGASDIVSPASGFSDSESDLGSQMPIYCPAHGAIPLIPVRYLNRHFPLLPAVQEQAYQSDTYDEGGSTYSSGQNSDQMILYAEKCSAHHHHNHNHNPCGGGGSSGGEGNHGGPQPPDNKISSSNNSINEWRLRQLRRPGVQRSDAIYISDDGKSSIASSPGRICPRCLEKEGRPSSDTKSVMTMMDNGGGGGGIPGGGGDGQVSGGGMQFDSGIIDVVDCSMMGIDGCGGILSGGGGTGGGNNSGGGGVVKNVSFETCTSSDSAISQGFSQKGSRSVSWNKPCTVSLLPRFVTGGIGSNGGGAFKYNPNQTIEEVTTTNSNSSGGSTCGGGGGGGGGGVNHNQGIQTDLPSPPPSIDNCEENGENHHQIYHQCLPHDEGSCGGAGSGGFEGPPCSSTFCVTVTTFGINPDGVVASVPTTAKATDV